MTLPSKLTDVALLSAVSPGTVLSQHCKGMTIYQISLILDADIETTLLILAETCPISPMMCLRLAHYFNTDYTFWSDMQRNYEMSLCISVEHHVQNEIEILLTRFKNPSPPDISDKSWIYYKEGEYKFSTKNVQNSLPIRTKKSKLAIVEIDGSRKHTNPEIFEVWHSNSWLEYHKLHTSVYLSERRVSDYTRG